VTSAQVDDALGLLRIVLAAMGVVLFVEGMRRRRRGIVELRG
jgi:hypothetical protein